MVYLEFRSSYDDYNIKYLDKNDVPWMRLAV